jgi:nucleoid-associated protein YgaU
MMTHGGGATRASAVRATVLTLLAIAAAALTWRLRPSTPASTRSPDADIVLGCAWLAWALAGYVAVAVAAGAAAHVMAGIGMAGFEVAGDSLTRIAPAGLRRLIDSAVTFSVAATILGTAAATPAGASTPFHAARGPSTIVTGPALDWPGLSDPLPTVHPHSHRPAPASTAGAHHQRPNVGLVNGGGGDRSSGRDSVVVRAGDTLWTIAARHLGPDPSDAMVTAAWHEWYVANRAVIGPDPSVIHPGQQLLAPASAQQPGSSR